MTLKKAKEILKDYTTEDELLQDRKGNWQITVKKEFACFDEGCSFEVDFLEAIAYWMRNTDKFRI
jgi:hypothetical protein